MSSSLSSKADLVVIFQPDISVPQIAVGCLIAAVAKEMGLSVEPIVIRSDDFEEFPVKPFNVRGVGVLFANDEVREREHDLRQRLRQTEVVKQLDFVIALNFPNEVLRNWKGIRKRVRRGEKTETLGKDIGTLLRTVAETIDSQQVS